jgi:beta-glucosidase
MEFKGFVMTDWWSTTNSFASARVSDMMMPGETTGPDAPPTWGPNLYELVKNGVVPEARVTDMAARILSAWLVAKEFH